MSVQFSLSFEVIRGLQILAALVVLIWFRGRIVNQWRFGVSLLLVCASAAFSALLLILGVDLTPKIGEMGALRLLGVNGAIEAASLVFFFFSFLDFPWEVAKADKPEPKPRPRVPAKKATTRKKKTSG